MRMYIEIRNVNEGASENKLWQSDPVNSSLRWQDSYLIQLKAYRWCDFFFNAQDMARSVVLNFFVNSLKNRLVP